MNSIPQSPKPPAQDYTRRLIPRKYISMDAIDENFDEQEWMKKLYGQDIRFVDSIDEVPEGWILVDGNFRTSYVCMKLTTRSQPSTEGDC